MNHNPIQIDSEFHNLISPISQAEMSELESSIRAEGIRDALVVWENILLDGHNRYEIAQKLNVLYRIKPIDLPNRNAAKEWIVRNQFARRNLSPYQRSCLALKLKDIIAARAKERQKEHGKTAPGRKSLVQKSAPLKSKVRDELASIAGVSHDTIMKVARIEEKADEKTKQELIAGSMTINAAYKKVNPRPRPEQKPLPEGIYNVIYADPPWQYRNTGVEGAAEEQYDTLSIEQLCELKVREISFDNAVLFLWTTNPIIEECFPVIKSWGFSYKTNLCWHKKGRKTGIGFYALGVHEQLFICIRGQEMTPAYKPLSLFSIRPREHSRKPDEVYSLIEKMYPNGRYLELFARNPPKRKGWTFWGAEINENLNPANPNNGTFSRVSR